jgi:pyruvate/2-oxoglutarate/acetoin dehydrogenase E1 component
MRTLSYSAALETAMAEEMRRDSRVFTMATAPSGPLLAEFGPARVRQTPISEAALTGIAVGSAGSGYRPVVNWRSVTFSFVAMDQVVNQACKIRYMFGAQRDFPIVFRAYFMGGTRSAAQHSQTGYAMYAHLAGLKIILPSCASDALGLLKSAIRDNNPVVCFEASRMDPVTEEVPDGDHLVPLGQAAIKRPGNDVTIVGLGYMVQAALEAANDLHAAGISAEVVDPRTLVPLDVATIRASVQKTGRLLVVDESPPTCSMAAEIATTVAEDRETFRALQAPVQRLCAAAVPVPYSPPLEDFVLPNRERIAAAARALLEG